ncbi:MAG TPA: ABC transporter substrate-binding protein [Candidatus Merdenecus merdavium]|nr:ABC transporter substrate-binding protein [Candidatus Merdenecus merdavium]
MKKFIIFVIIFCITVMSGCESNSAMARSPSKEYEKGVIKIGTPDGNGRLSGIEIIAQSKGFLEEELEKLGYGIEVVGFAGAGPAVNEALASGKIDFASYADVPALILESRGLGTKLITVTDDQIHSSILVRKDSGIETFSDLKGKKIAFYKGTYSHRYLTYKLEQEGMEDKDVQMIQMGKDSDAALIGNTVDAVVTTQLSGLRLLEKSKEIRMLDSSQNDTDFRAVNVFTSLEKTMNEKPDAVEGILNAFERAKEYAENHPEESYELMAEKALTTIEIQKELHSFETKEDMERYDLRVSDDELKELEKVKNFLLEYQLIEEDFEIKDWNRN